MFADEWHGYEHAAKRYDASAGRAWSHVGTAGSSSRLSWHDAASKWQSTGKKGSEAILAYCLPIFLQS